MSFEAAIRAFEEKAKQQMNTSVCNAVEFLMTENIKGTLDINLGGYSQGHIANNWRISLGGPDLTLDPTGDKTGNASFSRAASFKMSKPFYGKDDIVFITNSVNYSLRADVLGWPDGEGANGWKWSGKVGPYGFRGKAINNFRGKYM